MNEPEGSIHLPPPALLEGRGVGGKIKTGWAISATFLHTPRA